MRVLGALFGLAAVIGVGPSARAAEALGPLEREAVHSTLAARGFEVDPAPSGKVVGEVHVTNLDVFSERDGLFQLLNWFHRTTREDVIRRESLLQPGAAFDAKILDETVRNLQHPDFSSIVALVPVKSSRPGEVDLLIVTRDVWSLRLNTDFKYYSGELIYFTASFSENNLFGWRKKAAVVFDLDQGRMSFGPTYVDPNVAGTRLVLQASARVLYEREIGTYRAGDLEGSSLYASLAYPLYSLASKWGGSLEVSHAKSVFRSFTGSASRTVDLQNTPEVESLPWHYKYRSASVQSGVVRSFGHQVIQRLSFGHALGVSRPSYTDDFPEDPAVRALFAEQVFPRSERTSALFASYSVFTPRYTIYRDFATFDLREDVRLGPSLDLRISGASSLLGSERDFVGLSAGGAWALALGGGYQQLWAGSSARFAEGSLVDKTVGAGVFVGTPILGRAVRMIAEAKASFYFDGTANHLYVIGDAMRGYAFGEFAGRNALMLGHLEFRSRGLAVSSLRLGALAFWDVGHVADRAVDLVPHHDVGIGLRLLIPQLQPYVLRFDWAFATQSTRLTRAGWPGRLSIGFRQVF